MGYLSGKVDGNTTLDAKTDLRSGFERFTPATLAATRPDIISSEIFLFGSAVVLSLTLLPVPAEKDACH